MKTVLAYVCVFIFLVGGFTFGVIVMGKLLMKGMHQNRKAFDEQAKKDESLAEDKLAKSKIVTCQHCGMDNSSDHKVCQYCGAVLNG